MFTSKATTPVLFLNTLLLLLLCGESIITLRPTVTRYSPLFSIIRDDIVIEEEPYTMTQISLMSPCESSMNEFGGAETLDGRLLCASECAYGTRSPYFNGASFHSSTVVKRIARGVNSVLVGETVDGIVIAFRGKLTMTSSSPDWLQNAAFSFPTSKRTALGKDSSTFLWSHQVLVGSTQDGFA